MLLTHSMAVVEVEVLVGMEDNLHCHCADGLGLGNRTWRLFESSSLETNRPAL